MTAIEDAYMTLRCTLGYEVTLEDVEVEWKRTSTWAELLVPMKRISQRRRGPDRGGSVCAPVMDSARAEHVRKMAAKIGGAV
jgi:hypothetical protein